MKYTFPITKDMVTARSTLSISNIHANTVCRAINAKPFPKAMDIVENLASETRAIKGRYYTKTASQLLNLLKDLESNAVARNIGTEKMILFVSVHRGPTLYRLRSKYHYGRSMKICHVQAVLKGEKIGARKEIRDAVNKKG